MISGTVRPGLPGSARYDAAPTSCTAEAKKNEGPPPRSIPAGMSQALRRTHPPADRSERWHSRIGLLVSLLLHALLLLLVLLAPPMRTQSASGGEPGSSLQVTYIDPSLQVPSPAPPAVPKPPSPTPRKPVPAATRLQATPVERADDPVPLRVVDVPDSPAAPPEPPPSVPEVPARTATRPTHAWGQPPGMLPQAAAPVNAGPARSRAVTRGPRDAASSGAGLEVGGYQVYYDLLNEARLREWRDQGMTELFLPLPGTRRLMVCPLETALRRDSGQCRLVEPDDPGLAAIGDARDVITMQRIYKLGEMLWSGPGAYR